MKNPGLPPGVSQSDLDYADAPDLSTRQIFDALTAEDMEAWVEHDVLEIQEWARDADLASLPEYLRERLKKFKEGRMNI